MDAPPFNLSGMLLRTCAKVGSGPLKSWTICVPVYEVTMEVGAAP